MNSEELLVISQCSFKIPLYSITIFSDLLLSNQDTTDLRGSNSKVQSKNERKSVTTSDRKKDDYKGVNLSEDRSRLDAMVRTVRSEGVTECDVVQQDQLDESESAEKRRQLDQSLRNVLGSNSKVHSKIGSVRRAVSSEITDADAVARELNEIESPKNRTLVDDSLSNRPEGRYTRCG